MIVARRMLLRHAQRAPPRAYITIASRSPPLSKEETMMMMMRHRHHRPFSTTTTTTTTSTTTTATTTTTDDNDAHQSSGSSSVPQSQHLHRHLRGMSELQRSAITAPPGPTLVLAAPGSGKTRVVTLRLAYLVHQHGIAAHRICAVTFTNRAAAEMRHRLSSLLPPPSSLQQLQSETAVRAGNSGHVPHWIGTFHSICTRILRRDGSRVHKWMQSNFTVVTDSEALLRLLIKRSKDVETEKAAKLVGVPVLARRAAERISKWKNREMTASHALQQVEAEGTERGFDRDSGGSGQYMRSNRYQQQQQMLARVYGDYERHMQERNMLDFDDLLLCTVQLLSRDATVRSEWQQYFQALLVDEMQDTNHLQLKIVTLLTGSHSNIMAVGDPDQSIYTWRFADRHVMARMKQFFPALKVITLTDNYRSSNNIVTCSDIVIGASIQRHHKSMRSPNPGGPPVSIVRYPSGNHEAEGITADIQDLIAASKGTLRLSDIAILVRTHAQTRLIEVALHKSGVPYRLIKLAGFFDRVEIKDLMAYMRLIDNINDDMAFTRAISVPRRGVGMKRMEVLTSIAEREGCSLMAALERALSGKLELIDSQLKLFATQPIKDFTSMIRELRQLKGQNHGPIELLQSIIHRTKYLAYLQQFTEDADLLEIKQENVRELLNVCVDFERNEVLDNFSEMVENLPPLSRFLQSLALFGEWPNDEIDRESTDDQVVITTIHAAKGLEWPVVFVPGVEDGILPINVGSNQAATADDMSPDHVEEERRVLYVGMTRAKVLLSMSYACERLVAGTLRDSDCSMFLDPLLYRTQGYVRDSHKLFTKKRLPELNIDWAFVRRMLARIPKVQRKKE